ncbi:MAG: glycosyltransferase [Anaerolineaceae bacterium]|nr:glycosyltransferase [Anaerolineaceae bacterium]
MTSPTLSIVAPVYNEEAILPEFYARVRDAMVAIGDTWELILVNDGSRDNSLPIMWSIAENDEHVRVVNFARNFGHQVAVTAGIDHARGAAVVLIDADLQDPPEVITELVAKWREGYEVVYAVREEREGESWFKRVTAKLFYRILYRITDVKIPVDTGDFRLMDAKVAQILRDMREHNRFIRGMTSWVGFKQTGVKYVRHARKAGETKYPLRKMLSFALDAVTSFSYFPLQVMVYMAGFLGIMAIAVAIVISILRVTQGEGYFGGQATTIVLLLLLSSFQFLFLFLIGQYVARIYDETRNRPLYVVASRNGFSESENDERVAPAHGRSSTRLPAPPLETQDAGE